MRACIRLALLSSILLTVACDPEPMRPDGSMEEDAGPGSDECLAPREVCGSQCVDTNSDPRHCGECNNRCPSGGFCSMGSCETSCASPLMACGESCVDLSTSPEHCGDCDNPCASDEMCESGGCVCAEGLADCGGNCVDRMSSSLHCGRCDNPCDPGEACVMGMCQSTAESNCTDGMDNDMDGDADCDDSDCLGAERDCTCPMGMIGDMPTEVCEAGGWSTCGPCGPAPDCSPTNPCDYGWNCVSGSCVFNPGSIFDVVLVDAPFIPANTYGGGTWDSFGGSPDVYAEFRLDAAVMGQTSSVQDNTLSPVWNETILVGESATDLMSYLEIRVYDSDSIGGDDLIGRCRVILRERDFDGRLRTVTCARNDTEMTPGWRLNIQMAAP